MRLGQTARANTKGRYAGMFKRTTATALTMTKHDHLRGPLAGPLQGPLVGPFKGPLTTSGAICMQKLIIFQLLSALKRRTVSDVSAQQDVINGHAVGRWIAHALWTRPSQAIAIRKLHENLQRA